MDNTTTSSIMLGFIADIAKAVPRLGINHIKVSDGRLTASNFHTQIYAEVDIASLDHMEEGKRLDLSIEASPRNISILRSLGKSSSPGKTDISVAMAGNSYMFADAHSTSEIRKIAVRQTTTTISEFILKGQAIGTAITLSGKDELSLKGNEARVLLGVYGEQLASVIIPDRPEHFFVADTSRQMIRQDKSLFKSSGFLKFGVLDFEISLYAINEGIWLLTTGIFADGVNFNVIEKITNIL